MFFADNIIDKILDVGVYLFKLTITISLLCYLFHMGFKFYFHFSFIFFFFCSLSYGQWVNVGGGSVSPGASLSSIGVSSSDVIYLGYQDSLYGNKLSVKKFTGNGWVYVGTPGISSDSTYQIDLKVSGANVPFVAYTRKNSSDVYVSRFDGSSWNFPGGTVYGGGYGIISLDINELTARPCLAYSHASNGYRLYVSYFQSSPSIGSWNCCWNVYGTSPLSSVAVSYKSMRNSPINGYPYTIFRDPSSSNKATVRSFDGLHNNWIGSPGFSTGQINFPDIAITTSGNIFVAYQDVSIGSKLIVKKLVGTSWVNVGSPVSADTAAFINIEVDTFGNPYVAYQDYANGKKATVKYFNGSTWTNVGTVGISSGIASHLSFCISKTNSLYLSYTDNAIGNKVSVMKFDSFSIWTGASSTSWDSTSNWLNNIVPDSSKNVLIPDSALYYPVVSNNSSCKNIVINPGGSLIIDSAVIFSVAGSVTNYGVLSAQQGTLRLNGTNWQTISSNSFFNNTIEKLIISNDSGVIITDTLLVTGCLIPNKGILTINGNVVLKTDSNRSAYIGQGKSNGGYINGSVTAESYIPGRRAFRFFAHPFASSLALSQLTDDIDITGMGGSTNGFTNTTTNNPSAFYFDQSVGDNSTTGNNPGWQPYNSTLSNSWGKGQVARIMVRGAKNQGLSGAAYTPSNLEIDMTGPVNQGDQTFVLNKGSNSDFVLIGNPFPAPISMDSISGLNIGSSFYLWNAQQGLRGGYTSYLFGNSNVILPMCSGFVTTLTGNGSITFEESDKAVSIPTALFKSASAKDLIELTIEDSSVYWDRLLLRLDNSSSPNFDFYDAVKLLNPDLSFYTLSSDDTMLSIDTRGYDNLPIRLGVNVSNNGAYKLVVKRFDISNEMYLYDSYSNKTALLREGFEYWFSVNSDLNSSGNNRFELRWIVDTNDSADMLVQISPNPVSDKLIININGYVGVSKISIFNNAGSQKQEFYAEGNIMLDVSDYTRGLYFVHIIMPDKSVHTRKFVKL